MAILWNVVGRNTHFDFIDWFIFVSESEPMFLELEIKKKNNLSILKSSKYTQTRITSLTFYSCICAIKWLKIEFDRKSVCQWSLCPDITFSSPHFDEWNFWPFCEHRSISFVYFLSYNYVLYQKHVRMYNNIVFCCTQHCWFVN